MPQNTALVRVGVTGLIAVANLGVTAPTSSSSSLGSFTDLGFCGDGGVTQSFNQTLKNITAWQNASVVRRAVTDGEVMFKTTLIQTDANTIALGYGGTIAGDGSIIISPAAERPHKAFVLDIVDGTEKIRHWIPDGQITELGDIVYQNGEPIGYEVTIVAYPHASLNSGAGAVQTWFASLAAAAVPTISAITPSGAAAGALVKIAGTGFATVSGAAGVKFGGTNATNYVVVDDSTIYATLPAGGAGTITVLVTNATGGSTATNNYTRA